MQVAKSKRAMVYPPAVASCRWWHCRGKTDAGTGYHLCMRVDQLLILEYGHATFNSLSLQCAYKPLLTTIRLDNHTYHRKTMGSFDAPDTFEGPFIRPTSRGIAMIGIHPRKTNGRTLKMNDSARMIIFHQPRFPWNKGSHFPSSATFWGEGNVWGRYKFDQNDELEEDLPFQLLGIFGVQPLVFRDVSTMSTGGCPSFRRTCLERMCLIGHPQEKSTRYLLNAFNKKLMGIPKSVKTHEKRKSWFPYIPKVNFQPSIAISTPKEGRGDRCKTGSTKTTWATFKTFMTWTMKSFFCLGSGILKNWLMIHNPLYQLGRISSPISNNLPQDDDQTPWGSF